MYEPKRKPDRPVDLRPFLWQSCNPPQVQSDRSRIRRRLTLCQFEVAHFIPINFRTSIVTKEVVRASLDFDISPAFPN